MDRDPGGPGSVQPVTDLHDGPEGNIDPGLQTGDGVLHQDEGALNPIRLPVEPLRQGSPITAQDASLALAGADVWTLADGGALVDELLALGAPEELLADQSPLVDSLDELLDTILGQGSPFINTKREKAAGKIPGLPDLSGLRRFLSGENHVAP